MGFKKGQSGNPGGRPKLEHDVRQLAQQHGPEAITRLVGWMQSDNAKASVAASQALLDRGFGKPTQPLEHTDPTGGNPFAPLMEMIAKNGRPRPSSNS